MVDRNTRAPEQNIAPLVVDEHAVARAVGMSVDWVRKDRYGKRILPFCRIGGRIRYNLESVRAALSSVEEGGARRPRGRTAQ